VSLTLKLLVCGGGRHTCVLVQLPLPVRRRLHSSEQLHQESFLTSVFLIAETFGVACVAGLGPRQCNLGLFNKMETLGG
jgi:hypothetical protein